MAIRNLNALEENTFKPYPYGYQVAVSYSQRLRNVDQRDPRYWVHPPWWRPFQPAGYISFFSDSPNPDIKKAEEQLSDRIARYNEAYDEFCMDSAHSEALAQDRAWFERQHSDALHMNERIDKEKIHPEMALPPRFKPPRRLPYFGKALEQMSANERGQLSHKHKPRRKSNLKPKCYGEDQKHAFNAARRLSRKKWKLPAVEVIIAYSEDHGGWWIFPDMHPHDMLTERGKFYDGVNTHPSPYKDDDRPTPKWDVTIRPHGPGYTKTATGFQEHEAGEYVSISVANWSAIGAEVTALQKVDGDLIDCVMIDADWVEDSHITGRTVELTPQVADQAKDPTPNVEDRMIACEEFEIDYSSMAEWLGAGDKPFAAVLAKALDDRKKALWDEAGRLK